MPRLERTAREASNEEVIVAVAKNIHRFCEDHADLNPRKKKSE
jgi:hypothetical protein